MFSKLNDRILWYDGDISVEPHMVMQGFRTIKPDKLFVTDINSDIEQYNKISECVLKIKTDLKPFDLGFDIPEEYKDINLLEYLLEKLDVLDYTEAEIDTRINRIQKELAVYEKNNLFGYIITLIYVINTFTENNIVWGVGRGSSVSSYVLYLIGVHDIDSVTYDLDFTDFLKN